MNLAKHCEICDNRVFDFSTGTSCGLTGRKPEFFGKCPDIKFESNYLDRIKEVYIDYHKVASTRNLIITNFILFLSFGILVMAGGYFFGSIAWDKGVISTVPLIIMGIGFSIIPFATGPLTGYIQNIGVEKKRKSALDNLLASYNIKYEVEILIDEDVHGNKDYDAKVTFLRFNYK